MADETEVIQHQMEETRSRLADNLDKLSKQTVGTVEEVASTVSETVGAVQDTVQTVTDTVQQTVVGVKDLFDIQSQVERNPWFMFGGSVALGFLVGNVVTPSATKPQGGAPDQNGWKNTENAGHANRLEGHWPNDMGQKQQEQSSWFEGLESAFGPALEKLKGLAIGAALGVARDALTSPLTGQISSQLREVFDDVTRRLGGQPVARAAEPKKNEGEKTSHKGVKV